MEWPKFAVKKLYPNNVMREILRRTRMRDFICWTGIKAILPKSPRTGGFRTEQDSYLNFCINEEIQMREKNIHIHDGMPPEGPSVQERMDSEIERFLSYMGTDFPERPTNDDDLYLYKKAMRIRYVNNVLGIMFSWVDEEVKKEMDMEWKEAIIRRDMKTWTGVMRHPIRYVKDLFNNEKRSNLVR